MFCQVAHCYSDVVTDLPHDLVTLLHHQGPLLDADMRMASELMLMYLKYIIVFKAAY